MKRGKKLLAAALAATMVVSMAGCGSSAKSSSTSTTKTKEASSDSGKTTLTFWSWLPTNDQSDALIKGFEKENPDITIKYTRTEQDDFFEKLQVAMSSGTGPDLYGMTTGSMMDQYARFSANMKDAADKYWSGWDKDISKDAVDQCTTADGTMVGMPLLQAGMTTILYNKTLMDECGIDKVPTTYDELKEDAQKAKAKGYVCLAAGAADDWVNTDWFVQTSNEFKKGAVYDAEKGKIKWTDQTFVDTMNAWKKLFDDGIVEDGALGVNTYPDARDQYFFARKSLFLLTGSWHLGAVSPSDTELKGTEISNKKDVIGMAPFPAMSPSGEQLSTVGVDIMISMNKDCKHQEAAMKFIKYLSDGDGQQYWVNYMQGSPVSNKISYTGKIDGELEKQSIDDTNKYIKNAAGARKLSNNKISKAIQVAMQNVAAGSDPAKELKTVQQTQDSLS